MSRESETRAVVDKIRAFVRKWYPEVDELNVSSTYRSSESDGGTWSHHNGQMYGGSRTAAVDYYCPLTDAGRRRMQHFAKWLFNGFGDLTVEMLHSTPFNDDSGFYVSGQRKSGLGYPEHHDHIHYATSSALIAKMEARAKSKWGAPSTPAPKPPAPKPPASKPSPAQSVVAVTPYFGRPALKKGASGGAVGHLLFLLRERLKVTDDRGEFDQTVEDAVKALQRSWWGNDAKLANGVVGKWTWRRLEVMAGKSISTGNRPVLQRGSKGMWVGYAQHALRKAGYKVDDLQDFPFGPQTEAAVKRFKGRFSWLNGDGKITDAVWQALDAVEAGHNPTPPGQTPPATPPPSKYNDTVKPLFGADLYDFTVNAGLTESNVRDMVRTGGMSFLNAKVAEVDADGNKWVHTGALRMLTAAKGAGLVFPMGFVVPRSGVSAKTLMDLAIKALDDHCPWWRADPAFSFQVDTEKWSYDAVSIGKGIEVAKYIRDVVKRPVVAVYAPDWGYEGAIGQVKSAGFNWWASEYVGSGASRNYREMYNGAGGANAPGWRVVDGVKPVLNQYCSDGKVPGYGGELVMTAFNGTALDFAKLLGIT